MKMKIKCIKWSTKKLFDNFRLDHFIIGVNYEDDN